MRPTLGHITAEALALVYSSAYAASGTRDGDRAVTRPDVARNNANDAVRDFLALVEQERGGGANG